MALTYYCSKCAAKISYLTEKPKSCPKCNHSFGGALENATKRAEVIAAQQVSVAGKTKFVAQIDEEDEGFEQKELQKLERLEKLKKRKKTNAKPIRRINADEDMDDETDEVDASELDLEEGEEDLVDPRAKHQLKQRFLQTLAGDSGFKVEGSNESTTLLSIMRGDKQ